jgi:hypothetical protein
VVERPRRRLLRAIESRVLDEGHTDREHLDRTLPAANAEGAGRLEKPSSNKRCPPDSTTKYWIGVPEGACKSKQNASWSGWSRRDEIRHDVKETQARFTQDESTSVAMRFDP